MPTTQQRRAGGATMLLLALPIVSGCMVSPTGDPREASPGPTNVLETAPSTPSAWTEFESCPGGPDTSWVWVDGFPNGQLEAVGIVPQCADTWFQDDGDHFTGVVATGVRFEQFDALSEEMVAAGWKITYDDLVEVEPGTSAGHVGWRDYERDGGDTAFIIEVYYDGDGAGYTVYADLHSPGTRALVP
jgi:hypothetical protein